MLDPLPIPSSLSPPSLAHAQAQPRPALPAPAAVSPHQLWAWLAASSSFAELHGLVATFHASPAFTGRHAALAARQLASCLPSGGPQAPPLLLMERLAAHLAAAAGAGGRSGGVAAAAAGALPQLLPSDAAGAVWGMARVGYRCEPELLQALVEVAAGGQTCGGEAPQQQQERRQQQQELGAAEGLSGSDIAMLAAGVTGQGLPLPGWLSAAALSRLRARSLDPWGLQQLLLAAAAQATRQQPRPHGDSGGGGGCDARALAAAAAAACLARLQDFSSEALAAVVDQLDALGARGACAELSSLFQRASEALVKRCEPGGGGAGAALGQAPRRGRLRRAPAQPQAAPPPPHQQQQHQAPRAGGLGHAASVAAAAVAGGYSALARADPALCALLLAGKHHLTSGGGVARAAAAAGAPDRRGEALTLGGVKPAFAG
jgi:hypothetical protein